LEAAEQKLRENGVDLTEIAKSAGVMLKDAAIILAAKMADDACA